MRRCLHTHTFKKSSVTWNIQEYTHHRKPQYSLHQHTLTYNTPAYPQHSGASSRFRSSCGADSGVAWCAVLAVPPIQLVAWQDGLSAQPALFLQPGQLLFFCFFFLLLLYVKSHGSYHHCSQHQWTFSHRDDTKFRSDSYHYLKKPIDLSQSIKSLVLFLGSVEVSIIQITWKCHFGCIVVFWFSCITPSSVSTISPIISSASVFISISVSILPSTSIISPTTTLVNVLPASIAMTVSFIIPSFTPAIAKSTIRIRISLSVSLTITFTWPWPWLRSLSRTMGIHDDYQWDEEIKVIISCCRNNERHNKNSNKDVGGCWWGGRCEDELPPSNTKGKTTNNKKQWFGWWGFSCALWTKMRFSEYIQYTAIPAAHKQKVLKPKTTAKSVFDGSKVVSKNGSVQFHAFCPSSSTTSRTQHFNSILFHLSSQENRKSNWTYHH